MQPEGDLHRRAQEVPARARSSMCPRCVLHAITCTHNLCKRLNMVQSRQLRQRLAAAGHLSCASEACIKRSSASSAASSSSCAPAPTACSLAGRTWTRASSSQACAVQARHGTEQIHLLTCDTSSDIPLCCCQALLCMPSGRLCSLAAACQYVPLHDKLALPWLWLAE